MDKPDLIPVQDLGRANPMIWEGEDQAQGVFLDTGESDDPLALLGTPSLQPREEPRLPSDFEAAPALREILETLRDDLLRAARGEAFGERIEIAKLETASREALPLMLGRGEVSGRVTLDSVTYEITESIMAGLWHIRGEDHSEWLEVATVPAIVEQAAANLGQAPIPLPRDRPGIMNGLAVLAEVSEHAARWDDSAEHNRVLNFTLMPMSPQDLELLTDVLGRADLVLESGGFGNCKIMATTVRHVWAVQYLNAMGTTILDTLEIGRIPDAALAAPQDLEDSAGRLEHMLETYLS